MMELNDSTVYIGLYVLGAFVIGLPLVFGSFFVWPKRHSNDNYGFWRELFLFPRLTILYRGVGKKDYCVFMAFFNESVHDAVVDKSSRRREGTLFFYGLITMIFWLPRILWSIVATLGYFGFLAGSEISDQFIAQIRQEDERSNQFQ